MKPVPHASVPLRNCPAYLFQIPFLKKKEVNLSRHEYYEAKFEKLFASRNYVPVSLVAEKEEGSVVGFVMGELFIGEYGISQEEATLDTIGVDPDCQHKGVGEQLIKEFVDHLKRVGVGSVTTLVRWDDPNLIRFFSANNFKPSETINLELRF